MADGLDPAEVEQDIPVVHRLAILYLVLPVGVWLAGWFEWWFGFPATALLAFGLWKAMSGCWKLRLSTTAFVVLLMAAGWVMLTAAGGVLLLDNYDWPKHRAIFTDLGQLAWPVRLPDYLQAHAASHPSTDPLLRYYIGYYMVPGLASKLLGSGALDWIVPLWTWCGVALIAIMFTRGLTAKRAAIAAAMVAVLAVLALIFFGGMDVLWTRILHGWYWPGEDYERLSKDWFLPINYRNNFHSFTYAPQHFIPAGLGALLLAQLRRQPRFMAVICIAWAASIFWSPFAALGLAPLAAAAFIGHGFRTILRWQNLLIAAPLAGLVLFYFTSGAAAVSTGWIWERYEWAHIVRWMPLFYMFEFAALSGLLLLAQPCLRRDVFFIGTVVALFIVPLYHVGGTKSEMMRHAPIPALIVLCWYSVLSLNGLLATPLGALLRRNPSRIILVGLVAAALFVSVDPTLRARVSETVREVRDGDLGVFEYDRVLYSTLVNLPRGLHPNYSTHSVLFPLSALLRDSDDTVQATGMGEPIIQSAYNVYLRQDTILYVKESCSTDDAVDDFFLRIYPAEVTDLRDTDRRIGYEQLAFGFSANWIRTGGSCVAVVPLPRYEIRRIVTGQGTIWKGEATFYRAAR